MHTTHTTTLHMTIYYIIIIILIKVCQFSTSSGAWRNMAVQFEIFYNALEAAFLRTRSSLEDVLELSIGRSEPCIH